jgi:hypothetical protein
VSAPPELGFDLPFEIDLERLVALPDDEREEAFRHIQEFKRRLANNPMWTVLPHEGEHGYKTANGIALTGHESRGQVEFLELNTHGVFLGAVVASNRFGKTHINIIDAAVQTLPKEFVPPWLLPYKQLDPAVRDIRMRFIGPDKDRWRDRACVPKMRSLLPPEALHGGSFDKAWKVREGILHFADGSWWDFLTHDMELDAFASVELDSVRIDEEPTGEVGERQYAESVRGLIDRAGNVRITLTPVEGIGWLYDELADENGDPRKDVDAWCVTGAIEHNPHISEQGRERAKKVWAKRPGEYDARAKGLWTYREGLIFPEFKRELERPPGERGGGHLRIARALRADDPRTPAPRDHRTGQWMVPVFEAIDPGINVDHPFAFSVAFLNSGATDVFGMDDVLEVFYCFKAPDLTVNQQAQIVFDARAHFGYEPTFTVIDPNSAKQRNQQSGKELIALWREEGVYPVTGQNSRVLTYETVRLRLRGATPPGAPPDPATARYRVWTGVPNELLGDELVKYRWKKGNPRAEGAPRAEPVKKNDDLVDTQRYMLTRIPIWRGEAPIEDEIDDLAGAHPQQDLLRMHLRHIRHGLRRGKGGRVGGVWGR